MHMLVSGASMDSSAGLRDSDMHAIRCADVCDQLSSNGYFIRVVSPHKSQPVSHPERDQSRSHDKSATYNALKGTTIDINLTQSSLASVGAGVGMMYLHHQLDARLRLSLFGSLPEILYSVQCSYYGTFLVFYSLLKIETERRREGK